MGRWVCPELEDFLPQAARVHWAFGAAIQHSDSHIYAGVRVPNKFHKILNFFTDINPSMGIEQP